MSSLTIRRQLRRHRGHLALIAAVFTLVGVIAAHHSGALVDMHDMSLNAAVEMCLGAFTAVAAALVASTAAVLALARRRPALALVAAGALTVAAVPVARARHGPATVSVLCVSRR